MPEPSRSSQQSSPLLPGSDGSLDTVLKDDRIEVRGCLSRTDWELVYLAANKFAQSCGLSIATFDLQQAELGAREVARAEPAAATEL